MPFLFPFFEEPTMRLTLIAVALLSALSIAPAIAEDAPAAPVAPAAEPAAVTGNFTIVSDYRFRGISQTYGGPAVQGGIDYAAPFDLYLGTWMSNVSGSQYLNGSGLEWDIYGGWKHSFGDVNFDVGYLFYYYPNASYANPQRTKYDNGELYTSVGYKWASLKLSYGVTNFFGTNNDTYGGACAKSDPGYGSATDCMSAKPGKSNGSLYTDLSVNIPVTEKLTINTHVGHQSVPHYGRLDYSDYKLGATYDLSGWSVGAAVIGTDAKKGWYYACQSSSTTLKCKKTGETTLVVSVGKTF
jgi:uncharacterized protein (TIGR02001 family)